MCTVTVLRAGDMLRVACNRDERRERPAAHPPFIARTGTLLVLTPQDPRGRGTWIAANSAGLVFALLNARSAASLAETPRASRGLVIPSLANLTTIEEAVSRLDQIEPARFAPFRLLIADPLYVAEFAAPDGHRRVDVHRTVAPLLFTSSSLGDVVVEGPRRALFDQIFAASGASASIEAGEVMAQQDAFHAHRWRDRPAVSVHMSRPDACTVSTTTVEVTDRQVRMLYRPAHFPVGTPVGLIIDRQDLGHVAAHRSRREHSAV